MSVDIDSFDGYNDVSSCTTRRARKEHRCSACGETIRPGDKYSNSFFVFDGSHSTVKRCLRCEELFNEISRALPRDEVPAERLDCGHTWEERHGESPPEHVSRLAFMTRDEVQAELASKYP